MAANPTPSLTPETPPAERLPEILRRFNDAVVLVHSAKLDLSFLRGTCRKTGCAWPRPRFVDTVRLLARLGHRRRRLAPHAEALPIDLAGARRALDLPPHVAHHALYDALATAELFLALRSALGVTRLRQLV